MINSGLNGILRIVAELAEKYYGTIHDYRVFALEYRDVITPVPSALMSRISREDVLVQRA